MAIDKRQRGWLTSAHHASLREILIHICARYHLICPSYCLMPDHAHFLWMGLSDSTDQQTAVKFFRRHWAMLLRRSGHALQKQPYDHVLDENERNPDAFEDTMIYIFNNPARAGFVEDWREWKHLGAIAAGYPDLDPRSGGLEDFRESFWKVHHKERARLEGW